VVAGPDPLCFSCLASASFTCSRSCRSSNIRIARFSTVDTSGCRGPKRGSDELPLLFAICISSHVYRCSSFAYTRPGRQVRARHNRLVSLVRPGIGPTVCPTRNNPIRSQQSLPNANAVADFRGGISLLINKLNRKDAPKRASVRRETAGKSLRY
jgi:hypothetical protein